LFACALPEINNVLPARQTFQKEFIILKESHRLFFPHSNVRVKQQLIKSKYDGFTIFKRRGPVFIVLILCGLVLNSLT
jgi:hypothetical protein